MRWRRAALVLLAACSAPTTELLDAGDGDAGPVDAGEARDAGVPDAGGEDAGLEDAGLSDAGPGDAGAADAGEDDDAGAVDAGVADAGDVDAGAADAGGPVVLEDAGTPDSTVTVDLTQPGLTVPDDFLGISVEWTHVNDYLGQAPVAQLLQNFAADGHAPVLRIGGNSEDTQTWTPDGGSITPEHLATLAALQSHLILGLNLVRNDPTNAAALVTAASALNVDAFELGNEPDLYALDGVRPIYYSPPFYQLDFDGYFPMLSTAASNRALFAAPAVYGTSWFSSLGSFFSAEHARLALVTLHRYPYNVCVLGQLGAPTIPDLFAPTATTEYATTFAPVVQTAAQSGLKVRIAEMNSVSCGGVPGVSDVFASGLWVSDVLFELASVGVAGANVHTPGKYAVFDFTPGGALEVRGLYYGMLLFSRATAQHGRWLPVTVSSTHQLRAWATVGSDGVARVALINEDLQAPAVASVALNGRTLNGLAWHLTAPSLDTATAITFAGQTFDGSTDGKALGQAVGNTVVPVGGAYRVALSPGSAVVLAVP